MERGLLKSAVKSKFYISIIFYLDSGASDFAEVSKFWTGLHRPSGDLDWVGSIWTDVDRFGVTWTDLD